MGRTGCGKTTLLEAICGLKPVRAGRVRLLGRDVTDLPPADRGVGYVPQDLALFPTHDRAASTWASPWRCAAGTAARSPRRVDELAELLGLGHLLDRRPQGLSGGEAQRVALGGRWRSARRVLLLDEPLSALDEDTRAGMYGLLRSVHWGGLRWITPQCLSGRSANRSSSS